MTAEWECINPVWHDYIVVLTLTRQTHVVSNWFQYVNAFDGDDLVHVLLFESEATCIYIYIYIECLDTSGYNNYYVYHDINFQSYSPNNKICLGCYIIQW